MVMWLICDIMWLMCDLCACRPHVVTHVVRWFLARDILGLRCCSAALQWQLRPWCWHRRPEHWEWEQPWFEWNWEPRNGRMASTTWHVEVGCMMLHEFFFVIIKGLRPLPPTPGREWVWNPSCSEHLPQWWRPKLSQSRWSVFMCSMVRGTQATNRVYSLATRSWIYSRRHTSMQRMHSLCLRLPSCSSHESTPGPLAPTRNPPPARSNPRGHSQGNSGNTRSKTNFHASRRSQNGHCPLIEPAACCRAWHSTATTAHIHLPVLC